MTIRPEIASGSTPTTVENADITVVGGAGHVGIPLVLALAESGLRVNVNDLNQATLDTLAAGKLPFIETGAEPVLARALANKRLVFSNGPDRISTGGPVIITIGTPIDEFLNPVRRVVQDCVEPLLPRLADGQLVILRSTVFPGTTDWLASWLDSKGRKLRIAFSTEVPRGIDPTPDVKKVFDDTVKMLGDLGHTMIALPKMPIDWRKLYAAQGMVSGGMMAANMEELIEKLGEPTPEDLETLALVSWKSARKLSGAQVAKGLQDMRLISRQILALWRDFDVMLSPVTLAPPPEIGHLDPVNLDPKEFNRRQSFVFGYTPPFNITGQPSMSLPMGASSTGLPIGMMFTGRYSDEATLYRLAAQIEEARPWQPWADHKPQVWG